MKDLSLSCLLPALLYALLYVVADTAFDAFFFSERAFTEELLNPTPHEVLMRGTGFLLIVLLFFTSRRYSLITKEQEKENLKLARFPNENPNPILRISEEGVLEYANDAAKPLLDFWGISPSEKKKLKTDCLEHLIKTPQEAPVFEITCDIGDRIFHFYRTYLNEEKSYYFYGRDITEETKAHHALETSEARFHALFSNAHCPAFIQDHDGTFLMVNPPFARLAQKEPEEILSKKPGDVFPEKIAHIFEKKREALLREKERISEEVSFHTGGEQHFFHMELFLVQVAGEKNFNISCVLYDITKQKAHEKILQQNRENMEKAQEIAKLGNWEWFFDTQEIVWSKVVYQIFEQDEKTFHPTYENFLQLVHPEDRDLVKSVVNRSLEKLLPYSINHRIITPNNREKIVHEEGKIILDDAGKPQVLIGTVQDITEIKETSDKIQQATKVFENSLEGVLMTDANGFIEYTNRAFTTITGYTLEEVIGKTPSILRSHKHDASFFVDMWAQLHDKGMWEGEIWNRRKNGEAYPQWLNITALTDDFGRVTKFISVFHDMTDIKRNEEELKYKDNYDALTNLPNKNLFRERLSECIEAARQKKTKLAILFIDIDRFKEINDSLSHETGDTLLQMIAQRLQDEIKKEGVIISRWGGDEFTFILPNIKSQEEAELFAQHLTSVLSNQFHLDGREIYVTTSIGISLYPAHGKSAEKLIQHADIALYQAKETGGNAFHIYSESEDKKSDSRFTTESQLRKALIRDEIVVYYQPKIDLAKNVVVGMEALARWHNKELGFVSPGEFIPLAEETGLIVLIGEYVLQEACRQTKEWERLGLPALKVSVNLSARQFKQNDLIETIALTLKNTDLQPEYLELEITESTAMSHIEETIETLEAISAMGVGLSIDDFGTGYSSLAYLKRFPLNTLKIDRSFVKDVTTDPEDAAIAETVITMAHSLKLKVVAEGAETKEQVAFLKERSCDEIQGFFYSKPLPSEAFETFVRDFNRTEEKETKEHRYQE